MRLLAMCLLTLTAACVTPTCDDVTIVAVECEVQKGAPDCYTVVELSNGTRWRRAFIYGQVGDTFKATTKHGQWVSTCEAK